MPEMYVHISAYECILSWAVCATRGYIVKLDTRTWSMMSARSSMGGWVGDDEIVLPKGMDVG